MTLKIGLADRPGGRVGRISALTWDPDLELFRGHASSVSVGLRFAALLELEPTLEVVQILAHTISGFLAPAEEVLLFELAGQVAQGIIVEIGSWQGRSTVLLGWGSRLGAGAPVLSVDPHTGSAEHARYLQGSLGTLPLLRSNLARAGLTDHVEMFVGTSVAAAAQCERDVGLLFIDGDHSQAYVDFLAWSVHLLPGAVVMFHDATGGWPQVQIDVDQVFAQGLLVDRREVASMAYGTFQEAPGAPIGGNEACDPHTAPISALEPSEREGECV